MKSKEILTAFLLITLSVFSGLGLSLGLANVLPIPQHEPQTLGTGSDNTLQTYPTVSQVFVKSTDTTVVASSSGRQLLEIQNVSGATTTAQVISCNFGDRAASLYSGFQLLASSSKSFNLDNLYRGAIHCIAPANGALITVTDF
jgi:hypothetical protein